MRREDNKGFTLAELLIVVAIIGVLVAISIPIFNNQLEKARDATSVANLRSAYAEAMTAYMTNDVAKSHWNSDSVHHVWINYKNGEINAIDVIEDTAETDTILEKQLPPNPGNAWNTT